jgi:hypothetical protein
MPRTPTPTIAIAFLTSTLALGLAPACTDDDPDADPDAGPPVLLEPPPDGTGLQLDMQATLTPGEEIEYCKYVVVPEDGALDVARFEHAYTAGSHHLLLYQTGLDAEDAPADIFPCAGTSFTDLGISGIAYAAQVATGELAYPEGVALKIGAGDVLLLQTHYLNASEQELDVDVRLNLWLSDVPVTDEAGTLFFYDWAIVVPAGEPATARMRCQIPGDVELLFGMSHMHRRGVDYRATLEGGELAEPIELFATTEWEGIEPARYQPAQDVTAGQVIDFQCGYEGEDERTIIEGPSADANEMCMFIASYWPRQDQATELCAGPGSGPVFSGDKTCGETVACVQGTDDAVAQEQCLIATCEASSVAAAGFMGCIFQNCQPECEPGAAGCDACVADHCLDAYSVCAAATCGD